MGIHGESLGGMIACHLAKSKAVDYLFADRTFCSLSEVAKIMFNSSARFFFNLMVDWNYDSSEAFTDVTCYKILACDPNDEIIQFASSLMVGVA